MNQSDDMHWDYIIVGAGSAGCVLANRLSENPSTRVLLLEAGPPDKNALIDMPLGLGKLLQDPKFIWAYPVEVELCGTKKADCWVRGKTLGGSSSVNGMLYMHGAPQDYEELEASGLAGWGWKDVLRCFRAIEGHRMGPGPARGGKGPLAINNAATVPEWRHPLCDAVLDAGRQMGLPVKDDLNDGTLDGIAYVNRTIDGGKRQSAARAFLDPVRHRPNLTVLTGVLAERLLFDGDRAVGVRWQGGAQEWRVRQGGEVIVSAGALESPKLLQLSGIGPADVLERAGIAVKVNSPNVGRNLREHLLLAVQFRLKAGPSRNNAFSGWRLAVSAAKYVLFKKGVLASCSHDVGGFVRTRVGLDRPDAQIVMAPFSMDPKVPNMAAFEKEPGMMIFGYPLRPTSEGSLEIQSSDSAQPPLIRANYLQTDYDRQVSAGIVRAIRKLAAQPALRAFVGEETQPGPAVQSDDDLADAFVRMGQAGYHVTGTCRMGTDTASVVDERLRVRGVQGLRVMDLSILPAMLSGNTNGPVMALAWRASELILEDAQ